MLGTSDHRAAIYTNTLFTGTPRSNFAFDGRCVTFSQPFVNFLKLARTQQRAAKDKMIGVDHLALATCGALEKASSIGLTLCAVRGSDLCAFVPWQPRCD